MPHDGRRAVNAVADAHASNRRHLRRKVFEPCRLVAATGEERAHLLNISDGGALLHAATAFVPGHRVRIVIGEIELPAVVAWKSDRRIGVTFMNAPDKRLLATLLR